jgi:hypothetical protein
LRQVASGLSKTQAPRQRPEAKLLKLLVLLVVLTIGCGVAAGVTVSLAPAHADDGQGYD